jgi:hypothetical protein
MKPCLFGLMLVFVVGCGPPKLMHGSGEPTLDTTSEESMQKSVVAMESKLSDEQKRELTGALLNYSMREAFRAEGAGGSKPHEWCKALHGLTAEQIIVQGKAAAEAMERAAKP